jgi:hypothetical protein
MIVETPAVRPAYRSLTWASHAPSRHRLPYPPPRSALRPSGWTGYLGESHDLSLDVPAIPDRCENAQLNTGRAPSAIHRSDSAQDWSRGTAPYENMHTGIGRWPRP